MSQHEQLIMDYESKGLVFFFKKLNVIFLILSIIGSFYLAYTVGTSIQQQKNTKEEIESFYSDSYYDDDDEDYYDDEGEKDKDKKMDLTSFFMISTFLVFASVFNYNLVLILLKHFSNVAELKQMKKTEYLK